MSAKVNLIIEQGATWNQGFTWKIDGTAVDLTGYAARMQMQETHRSSVVVVSLPTENGGGIVLGGVTGTVTLQMSGAATALLPAGKYVYDVELVSTNSEVTRLVEGTMTVTPEVTR